MHLLAQEDSFTGPCWVHDMISVVCADPNLRRDPHRSDLSWRFPKVAVPQSMESKASSNSFFKLEGGDFQPAV